MVKARWNANYLSSHIINLTNGASASLTSVIGNTTLAYDGTADNNLRYVGASPNNYITFNNEIYRIIGVMKNICKDTSCSTKETRVKIIRNDDSCGDVWNSVNSNKWEDASSKICLNSGSYWNSLSSSSKGMIDNALWYLGSRENGDMSPKAWYTTERSTTVYAGNKATWLGLVGLIYPSDYGLASTSCKDSSYTLQKINSYAACNNTQWIYSSGKSDWTITPYAHNGTMAARINKEGWLGGYADSVSSTTYEGRTRPVIYLKYNTLYISGNGTSTNPYKISI